MATYKNGVEIASDSAIGLSGFGINKLDRLLEWASKTTLTFKGSNEIPLKIGTAYFPTTADVTISTATDMDVGVISNGKDYYVYTCNSGGSLIFKISLASTFPAGFSAVTSRKIGGFHTLCVNVGTISGHTLTDYLANEILPQSVWDLKHRCRNSKNEGMVYSAEINKWVQIYLAADDGASGVKSVNGGTILDTIDWLTFIDMGAKVEMRLLNDDEFQTIAAGSNEETNITDSADPVTTGGHVDTAARRMISNIGCEDCVGVLWQWLRDQSFRVEGSHTHTQTITYKAGATGSALSKDQAETNPNAVLGSGADETITDNATDIAAWAWYDLPGAKGSLYRQGTYGDIKLLAGGDWYTGTSCGSRCRDAYVYRWDASANFGGRFVAEPL